MMHGVEFVLDRKTNAPAAELTVAVMERAKELGLLIGRGGIDGNVLRIKPPMCWTQEDCAFACAVLDQALSEVGG
jgi:alanine-glyoxylate transaminase/(R)-3-amino-2-methylpropionate-pyruvate transaminase